MNLKHKFNNKTNWLILLLLLGNISVMAYAVTEQDQQTDLIVKGKVSKGTCSFAFSSKTVEFTKPLVSAEIGNVKDTQSPLEPFSIQYICQDYSEEIIPDLQVAIKPDGNSNIIDGKLSPKNNVTNAAFVLQQCNEGSADCSFMNFSNQGAEVGFPVQNGENEKHFKVQVVKLDGAPIKSGKLSASVVFSFIQP